MRCKVCEETQRAVSNGEEVPQYVRGACKCERRKSCEAKNGCGDKVIAATLELDGNTVIEFVCGAHLPPGFDAEDFKPPSDMSPIADEEPPLVSNFEPTNVTCAACGHAHLDSQRYLFFSVAKTGEHAGKMIHRTGCPKCRSVLMNAV